MHLAITGTLAEVAGTSCLAVPGVDDHEVYLNKPEVLAAWVGWR